MAAAFSLLGPARATLAPNSTLAHCSVAAENLIPDSQQLTSTSLCRVPRIRFMMLGRRNIWQRSLSSTNGRCGAPSASATSPASLSSSGGENFLRNKAIGRLIVRAKEHEKEPSVALFQDKYARTLVDASLMQGSWEDEEEEEEDEEEGDMEEGKDAGDGDDGVFYLVSTRWTDERVREIVEEEGLECKQVVFLSDGVDTRPYRVAWPAGTILFDVSPASLYAPALTCLKEAGARVPRGCLLCHVSAELADGQDWRDEGWGEKLIRVGYRGDRTSAWVLQGFEAASLDALSALLGQVRCLASKGSFLVGSVPASTLGGATKEAAEASLLRLLQENHFTAQVQMLEPVAKSYGVTVPPMLGLDQTNWGQGILFLAQKQRLSELQVDAGLEEMARMEEDWGEDGFEDLV